MPQETAPSRPSEVRTTRILSADDVRRALVRIAHEISERNPGLARVVVVGMQSGGVGLSREIAANLSSLNDGMKIAHGVLDVSMYRDDINLRPVVPSAPSEIPVDLTGSTVVLVDDVLFTGRTVRAALEALNEYGRPRAVQLAVMVDRGHRELPIRPDYVGKNVPTHITDEVEVGEDGVTVHSTTGSPA